MSESKQHRELVKQMEQILRARYPHMIVLTDILETPGVAIPQLIGGYRPDVFGTCKVTPLNVICEAKTAHDLQQIHTLNQLAAFIAYLSNLTAPHFLLGVYGMRESAAAKTLLRQAYAHVERVCLCVYDGLDYWKFSRERMTWHLC